MRIAVIGATGHTGTHVIEQGLARGHHMKALARRPEAVSLRDANLTVARADALDSEQLNQVMAGCEAVISALGVGASRAPTVIYSQGIANALLAIKANAANKLAVISAAPVGPRAEQPFLERRVAMPVLERVFGATYDDMRRMEALLATSEIDWVSLRPPRLVNKPATGTYRLDATPLPKARSITYADLATALLDSLDRQDLFRRAVFVAN
ncbi:MAG: NAD(P)-dependent oxidoreductase [Solirubrobacteraceae bacterium]